MTTHSVTEIPLRVKALLGVNFLTHFAVMGQITIIGKQVYDLTGRPLDLGLLGVAEFLPVAVLAPLAGPLADRHDRRKILGIALVGEAIASLLLFLYARSDPTSITPIFAIVLFFGVCRAFAMPASRALPIDLSPPGAIPRVVALKSVCFQAGHIAGPITFGFAFVVEGSLPYLLSALALVAAIAIVTLIPSSGVKRLASTGGRQLILESLEGLRFIRYRPVLLGAMGLDLFAVLFGGALALLPAIAEDRLGVGAIGLGWLRAGVGIGAGATAVCMSIRPVQRHLGRTLYAVIAMFGLGTTALGLTRSFTLAFTIIVFVSAADAVSMFIRATLVPLATPENMRGRVLAVESVFIGASNELGAAESGLTAAFMGLVGAVVFGGVATLAVVALWWRFFPTLRDLDTFDDVMPIRPDGLPPGDP